MTTAFVLSGGASLGSIQVGMLLGLAEAGITPDLIVGTSVGAVNGGWVASQRDDAGIGALADVWRSLSRNDVFPTRPIIGLLGCLGLRSSLVPDTGLRRLLTDHLKFSRLEDAPIPLSVLGTPVKVGNHVGVFVVWPRSAYGSWDGGPQSGSRWSARSAARTNDLEVDEDPPHTVVRRTEAKPLWFKSSAASY
jgi:patatin-like phospholipase